MRTTARRIVTAPKKAPIKVLAKPKTAKATKSVSASARSKQLVVLPRQRTPAFVTKGKSPIVMREYKGSGQTVNIAVGQPQASTPAQTLVVPGVKQSEIVYVGAKGGNTVHTPYCMNARRIPRNKRVAFTTKKEAVNAGLVPCRLCRPFEGGM
jgi:hypothetical protein